MDFGGFRKVPSQNPEGGLGLQRTSTWGGYLKKETCGPLFLWALCIQLFLLELWLKLDYTDHALYIQIEIKSKLVINIYPRNFLHKHNTANRGSIWTILSLLWYTFILIETLFSQWGYQYTLIEMPLCDNNTFCVTLAHGADANYTIPIGIYRYPDWNLILPMRIPIYPDRDTLCDNNTFCVTLAHGQMPTILSLLGYTVIPIETLFSQWGYQKGLIWGNLWVTQSPISAMLHPISFLKINILFLITTCFELAARARNHVITSQPIKESISIVKEIIRIQKLILTIPYAMLRMPIHLKCPHFTWCHSNGMHFERYFRHSP